MGASENVLPLLGVPRQRGLSAGLLAALGCTVCRGVQPSGKCTRLGASTSVLWSEKSV